MPPKTALLAFFVLGSACAANPRRAGSETLVLKEKSPGLFVGHSQDGQVVIAATHYDAMNGLAVEDTDLGLEPRKTGTNGAMICRREVPTGSHVPHWMCRYTDDIEHERQYVLNTLQQPWLSPSGSSASGVGTLGSGNGGGSKTSQH